MNRLLLVITLMLLGPAAPAATQHVLFSSARIGKQPPERTLRVFLDAEGSVYPPADVPLQDVRLRQHVRLRAYFAATPAAAERIRRWSRVQGHGDTWWAEVQDSVISDLARQLVVLTRGAGSPRPLVVLIHGFNAPAADSAYAAARAAIDSVAGHRDHRFLEVHWDGMEGHPIRAWPGARKHAPHVGLGVRRLLRALPGEIPLRVLTHSLGGSVGTSALWERRRDAPTDHVYGRYAGGAAPYGFPTSRDVRVAMIVPAIGGASFGPPHGVPGGVRPQALVIGQNRRDYAVVKGPLGPELLGATTLATDREEFRRYVVPRVGAAGRACVADIHNDPLAGSGLVHTAIATAKRALGIAAPDEHHEFGRYVGHPSVQPLLWLLVVGKGPRPPELWCP